MAATAVTDRPAAHLAAPSVAIVVAVAAVVAVLTAVQVLVRSERPGPASLAVFTGVPLLVLAATVAVAVGRRHWIAAAALLAAVTPHAMSLLAAARWQGALAVLAPCGAVVLTGWGGRAATRWGGRAATPVLAGAVVAGVAIWVATTPSGGGAPAPGWRSIVGSTGDLLQASIGAVGEASAPIPSTALLAWCVAAGLVLGAAVLAGRWRDALALPAAVAMFVVVAWATARWRGPVDVRSGAWLLPVAVAWIGARVRLDAPAELRIGRAVAVAAGWAWLGGVAQQVRVAASSQLTPNGTWTFWEGWDLTTTSIPPTALLALAAAATATLVAAVWCASAARPRSLHAPT